ncbi:hypothetical protein HPB49_003271 [Dermacentor silvarum]|uniref:Uncharacterized protein n=1 Tax=Dermacentor silvarum TaxID=543639 RepID=A0ACB8DTX3_DERSI|nr:hypothetical protein HPB49_003271 [Dermacentor silvarum]
MGIALTEDVPKAVTDRGGKKEYVRSQFLGKDMVQRHEKLTDSEARIFLKPLFLLIRIAKLYTSNYIVPEMLARKGHRCEVDIWSIGCILLQSELEETRARMQTEGNAMKATIVQLDEAKATLVAEVSQLNNRSTQLNIRISGRENELQLTKTTTATFDSRLSTQARHSKTLRRQLADKDQQIASLHEKSAASDAMNQELLKSNAELNVALRTSEVEMMAQAERMREVVAENRKHQDALLQQNSKLLALDRTLWNLESKLTEAVGKSELLSSQLLVSEERCAKLEEAIATLRTELEASRSRCTELEQQLSQAECEKEAHSSRLLKVQNELNSVTRRADQHQARAQELEVSKQQLDTLCSELQPKSECQNRQAEKATAECAKLEQCIEKSAAEKADLEVRLENEAQVVHALKEKCAEHVAANEKLCSVNAASKNTIEEAKLKMEHFEARIEEMNNKNCALRNNLEEKGQRLDTLLAEKQMLQLKQLQQKCGSLKLVLADMSEKLFCREQEQASAARNHDKMASQVKELEDGYARLSEA